MFQINLRDYYPFYLNDCYIDVDDQIAATLKEFVLREKAYRKRISRHKAYYSLERDEGIEHDILLVSLSTCEIYERKVTQQELYAAIASLPNKQAKRIYAHYFLNMSKYAIARAEGVDEKAIRKSIKAGLVRIGKFLRKL